MSRRRRDDWSPYAIPYLRDATRAALERSAQHNDALVPRSLDDAMRRDFEEGASDSRRAAWALHTAELFWITAPMAEVALDASHDMPGFTGEDLPSQSGLILVEKPLPDKDTALIGGLRLRDRSLNTPLDGDWTEPVPIDGLLWHRAGATIRVWMLVRTKRLPDPLLTHPTPLTPFLSAELPLPADFTKTKAFLGTEGTAPTSDALGVLSWLAAAWHLMSIPTVAETRDLDASTGASAPAAPRGEREPGAVRLVDLRPMRHVRFEGESTETARTYRHRWVVRGHWRQQAVGPKRGQRRLTWVPSYIKGPEGAPLLTTDTVKVWRR